MLITIFTPTYNRGKLIQRLYKSLQNQTYNDFEWIIVDDGSTDNTKELIENFEKDNKHNFPIKYFYKDNGGKHTAINLGVKEAKGKLFFIADSDDILLDNSLEIIYKEYLKVKGIAAFGGICGLDCYANGEIIGSGLKKDIIDCNYLEIQYKYNITGDQKEVYYTKVMREFPFPVVENERFVPEALVWNRIAQKYKLRYINQPIYQVEYQEGGLTSKIIEVRMKSPIASTLCYGEMLDFEIPLKYRIKAAINYWRFYFCIKNKKRIRKKINLLWLGLLPIGFVFHLKDYLKIKENLLCFLKPL
ncbi:glycosyltransferase family A protein [Prevotella aurantiaca]